MKSVNGSSALITDVHRRKALPIIRSLGQAGVRVIGLSNVRLPVGWFSKYCAKVYHTPDYMNDSPGYLDRLKEICILENPDVLYPIDDVPMSLCVNNPGYWSQYTSALLPNTDSLETAYDKWKTIELAVECGVPVPESYCPSSREEVIRLAATLDGQLIIKPRKSSGSRGLRFVDNAADLPGIYDEVATTFSRPIIQERIPADGAGVGIEFLLSDKHQPLAIFGHKRLREYPISGGPSTLRESFRDDALIEQSLKLLSAMNFRGVAMVEYKFDERRQEYVLMEVNPRFWGSLPLAIHAGVDFPLLYQKASMGIPVEPVLDYPLGKYCRWLWPGDLLHFAANPNRLHLQPSFFQFRDANLAYDIISTDDPWPIIGMAIEAFRILLSRHR